MKKYLLPVFFIITSIITPSSAQTLSNIPVYKGWTSTHPCEHKVFVENKGQFSEEDKSYIKQPILYYNRMGKVQLYFTASSIIFRCDSVMNVGDNKTMPKDPDQQLNLKVLPRFLTMTWQNANHNAVIEVENPESDYFTYGDLSDKTGHTGVIAHAWKKLIYRNLYNNIDVEFYYPEKGGIEYNIIVHPGADISQVKMSLNGACKMILQNSDVIISSFSTFTIHAPLAKDEKGDDIATSFSIANNTISLRTADYDKTQLLTIDPWVSNSNLFVYNVAYDIDYDNYGNVYIAGGQPPYELEQFDSTGTLLWSYTATEFGGPPDWYGGFTTDERSGSCYIIKGLDVAVNTNVNVLKINNAGVQVAMDYDSIISGGSSGTELWRVAFDYINNQLVCAAGLDYQAALLDTDLNSIKNIEFINNPIHDMSLLALDNAGNAYMATCKSTFADPHVCNNTIFKLPLPGLLPVTDTFADHHSFTEFLSNTYYPPQINGGYDYPNGYNGMAANKNMIITYDGASLKKWNPSNSVLLDSVKVSATMFLWGGLDLDCKGNVYAGNNNTISVYDENLNFINSIPLSNTVFALKVGEGKLYACGYGFVQSINVNASSSRVTIIASANPSSYCLRGSSILTATGGIAYTWSPAIGLSTTTGSSITANPTISTTYIVTGINLSGCSSTDSVIIKVSSNGASIVALATPATICPSSSSTLTASGSINYTWYPANGLNTTTGSSVIATPTVTTTYTVNGSNGTGCTGTTTVVVTVHVVSPLTCSAGPGSYCTGGSSILTVSGGANYKWSPSTGLNTTTGNTVITNSSITTIYTVIGMDVNGCTNTGTVTVLVGSSAVITVTDSPSAYCRGGRSALTAHGGVSYTWYPATGLNYTTGATVIANPTSTTVYTATGTSGPGCTGTAVVTVTVYPNPTISVSPQNATYCAGQNVTLTASGASTYAWGPMNGNNSTMGNPITLYDVQFLDQYQVTGTSSQGCSSTIDVFLNINLPPFIHTISNPPVICPGDNSTLKASGGVTYTWSPSIGLSQTTGASVTAAPTVTTNYTVTGTDQNGCQASDSITLSVSPVPKITGIASPASYCTGGSSTLTASGGITYTWSPSIGLSATTGTNVTANPTVTTTYIITGTNAYGCSATGTVVVIVSSAGAVITASANPSSYCGGKIPVLTASGGSTYTWSPSTGLSATTGSSVTANPTVTTTYTVNGSSGSGCSGTTTVLVSVHPSASLTIEPQSPLLCSGDSIMLTVPASGSNYVWSPATGLNATTGDSVVANPTTDITYTVTGINSLGCSVSDTDIIDTIKAPNIPVITISVTGDTLFSSAENGNQWYENGELVIGATDSIFVITGNPKSTIYKLVVTDIANGCSSTSDAVTLGINQLSVINNQLFIYPNPTNGMITINISSSAGELKDWNLQVIDVLGRTLYIRPSLHYNNEIDLSDLSGGIYFITVITKTGRGVVPVVKE